MPEQQLSADELRQKDHYHRHLAAEVVASLPYERDDARAVLAYILAMLDVDELPEAPRPLARR